MADDHKVNEVHGLSKEASIQASKKAEVVQKLARMEARQVGSREDIQEAAEMMGFNPLAMKKKFETLKNKSQPSIPTGKPEKSEKESDPEKASSFEKVAQKYQKANPELNPKTLVSILKEMRPTDSHDAILKKLQRVYADKALVDEAIDFLIEVSETNQEMKQKYIQAKMTFNSQFGREIQAGRNIGAQARLFSQKGLGNPTALRDLYREVTGNPRTPHKLFEELTEKFKFSDMKNIIDFILHSLGADMKSKGPSISRAELQRLFEEARSMQAILGVFRFFFARMKMIKKQFDKYDLSLPSRINFEALARLFMKLIEERYPTPDKVQKLSFILGISEEIAAQIIIYTQYRDAMRHVAPKLFKSERHRQELLMALIETLSDLEDELMEEEEEDEE